MNVQNRKLFADRGARQKLSEMGGIMASSSDLLGEVQKFQDGTLVEPRGVPDSPRLSESLVSRAPIAVVGGQPFFLSDDGQFIVDSKGNMVNDAGLINAVLSQPEALQAINYARQGPETMSVPPVTPEAPSYSTLSGDNFSNDPNQGYSYPTDMALEVPPQAPSSSDMAFEVSPFSELSLAPSNRDMAFDKLKQQFSELSFFPDRTEGEIDTGPGFFSAESNAVRAAAAGRLAEILRPAKAAGGGEEDGFSLNNSLRSIFEPVADAARNTLSPVGETMRNNDLRRAIETGQATQDAEARAAADEAALVAQEEARNPPVEDNRSVLDQLRSSVYSNNPLETALQSTGLDSNTSGGAEFLLSDQTGVFRDGRTDEDIMSQSEDLIAKYRSPGSDALLAELTGGPVAPDRIGGRGEDTPAAIDLRNMLAERAAYADNTAAREAAIDERKNQGGPFSSLTGLLKDEMESEYTNQADFIAKTRGEVEDLNRRIAESEAAGDDILAGTLITARIGKLRTLDDYERSQDFAEGVNTLPDTINKAFQSSSLAVGLRGPDATANTLKAIEENNADANAQEVVRESYLDSLKTGAGPVEVDTTLSMGNPAVEEFNQRPDTGGDPNVGPQQADAPVRVPFKLASDGPSNIGLGDEGGTLADIEYAIGVSEGDPDVAGGEVANAVLSSFSGKTGKLDAKSSVKAYEEMFSEMLGMKDKDKEKEMWHNMAMIGFAIAAGESPNAVQNIANGMLAGTKMMKEDRASERTRKDKIGMMAIDAAQADKRAAEARGDRAAATLASYARADQNLINQEAKELRVAEAKLILKNQYDPKSAAGVYLGSEIGGLVATTYSSVMDDENLNDENRIPSFIKAVGQTAADEFFFHTNFPGAGSGGGLNRQQQLAAAKAAAANKK